MSHLGIAGIMSWVYQVDGHKYRWAGSMDDLKYSSTYGRGDTVGCGINMQTGTIFFTKNGVNLGKDSPIHTPT